MASVSDILLDSLGRVRETVHGLLDDVPEEHLTEPPAPGTNTIAWLVWHLTRVVDEHVADAFDVDVVWTTGGWYDRFALPFPASAHGYGMSYDDVLRVRAGAADLEFLIRKAVIECHLDVSSTVLCVIRRPDVFRPQAQAVFRLVRRVALFFFAPRCCLLRSFAAASTARTILS